MFQCWNIIQNPIIVIQENVFEYAIWNDNHLVSTEMYFNDCIQYVPWKVSLKASETYMVYFWVTLDQCIVLILNLLKTMDKFVSVGK